MCAFDVRSDRSACIAIVTIVLVVYTTNFEVVGFTSTPAKIPVVGVIILQGLAVGYAMEYAIVKVPVAVSVTVKLLAPDENRTAPAPLILPAQKIRIIRRC